MQITGPWWTQLTSAEEIWCHLQVLKKGTGKFHPKKVPEPINIRWHAWTSASRSTWMKICQHHSASLKVHDPGYQMQLPLCLGLGQMLLRPVVADRVWMELRRAPRWAARRMPLTCQKMSGTSHGLNQGFSRENMKFPLGWLIVGPCCEGLRGTVFRYLSWFLGPCPKNPEWSKFANFSSRLFAVPRQVWLLLQTRRTNKFFPHGGAQIRSSLGTCNVLDVFRYSNKVRLSFLLQIDLPCCASQS